MGPTCDICGEDFGSTELNSSNKGLGTVLLRRVMSTPRREMPHVTLRAFLSKYGIRFI